MKFMETKELRLMAQLEEAKTETANDEDSAQQRLKNVEELLEAKS